MSFPYCETYAKIYTLTYLSRYLEYTRVKLVNHKPESTDYINASYIQYIDVSPAELPSQDGNNSNDGIPRLESLSSQNESSMSTRTYRRYISTQGPLPATFRDFYTAVWEQNSLVIVMLTKEEEMNRVSPIPSVWYASFSLVYFI